MGDGRTGPSELVGFDNVAWGGGEHAFLIDTRPDPVTSDRAWAPRAFAARSVRSRQRAPSGWPSISSPALAAFYIDACGFRSTPAGLVHLPARQSIGR